MELTLRPNVCILLINRDNLLFLGERWQESGHWQFPQGGVEPDTSAEQSLVRELNEELGVSKEKLRIIKKFGSVNEYLWETPPAYAIGKWNGQRQAFWLVKFLGSDSDININTEQPEFMKWRWCSLTEVKALANPRRLQGYLPVLAEFEGWLKELKCDV